ncbi:DUF6480 family protein [Kitasatospora camelliae]|uniref:DUF6480 family protein n=1 Tax=Kitasatospora camelliae TaxID=3156397 RepID=A0AAU8JSP2_9ACTN
MALTTESAATDRLQPAPTETPEGEASTCHGISIPEPVELRRPWPAWIPLLVIALLVISVAVFAVARIGGW